MLVGSVSCCFDASDHTRQADYNTSPNSDPGRGTVTTRCLESSTRFSVRTERELSTGGIKIKPRPLRLKIGQAGFIFAKNLEFWRRDFIFANTFLTVFPLENTKKL